MKILKLESIFLSRQILANINKHGMMFLVFYLLNYCLYAQNNEVAYGFGSGSGEYGYYTIEEINTKMDELATNYPNICKPKLSIGTTFEGKPIYSFKISDNPNEDEPEPVVYYDAAHHGNEKIATAVTINYMMWLCEQYGSNDEVTYLVNTREIYFVPVVNVDGYIKGTRKNRNIVFDAACEEGEEGVEGYIGVDLNRNYPTNYGNNLGSSLDTCAYNFRGSGAFSERETRAVRDFIKKIKPKCAFSTHSAGGFVLMPSKLSEIPPEFNLYADLASEMYADNNYYYAITATTILSAVSSGTTRDYLDSLGIVAYTPEIRFFGLGIDSVKIVVAENIKPMRTLTWLSGAFPVVKYHQLYDEILPGSDFKMLVELKNKGQVQTGNNVKVLVRPSNSKITPITGTIDYYNIESQMTKTNNSNLFKFRVSDDAQIGDKINLLIKVLIDGVQTDIHTVTVVVGKKNILLSDDAELSRMNWTVSGEFGNEAGTAESSMDSWGRDDANSYSGRYSFSESKNGLASTKQSAYFTTNFINLNTSNIVKAQFAAKWSFGKKDSVILQASSNNSDWTNLEIYTQSNDWVYKIIDLSRYNEGSLKLRFWHQSNNTETGDGFYFDDFEIVEYIDPQTEVEWDNAPSECDDNKKRSIGVKVFNTSTLTQSYKISVYEGNTFMHGNSEINIEANDDKEILLKGIPEGTYTVNLEQNGSTYYNREFTFASCPLLDESPCEIRDKEALIALYNTASGDNWTITWDLNGSIDTWHGVTLNTQGCVNGLNLANNNLTGEIPPQLENLTDLNRLILYTNNLSGEIPAVLGNLSALKTLHLSYNDLAGEIPGTIGDLNNLELLNLSNNDLSGSIPGAIGNLINLNKINLTNNSLSGCYNSNLRNLCDVNVNNLINNGNSLPDWNAFCTGNDVDLCGEPQLCSGQKEALTKLYNATGGDNWTVTWNLDSDIDTWFGVSLNTEGCVTGLNLVNNNLTGEIPAQLENLTELSRLILYTNKLTGKIPVKLGSLIKLKILHLSHNDLTGEIPGELGMLENMELFNLSNNQLLGNLPPQLSGINENGALKMLKLTNNELTGCYYSQFKDAFCEVNTVTMDAGNSFNSSWEDFCTGINGNCIDRIKKSSLLDSYNYPNPFKQKSTIFFNLFEDGEVSIKVYNAKGDEIEILMKNSKLQKGENAVLFDGTNYPVGIYYYSIQNNDRFNMYKMTLIK